MGGLVLRLGIGVLGVLGWGDACFRFRDRKVGIRWLGSGDVKGLLRQCCCIVCGAWGSGRRGDTFNFFCGVM